MCTSVTDKIKKSELLFQRRRRDGLWGVQNTQNSGNLVTVIACVDLVSLYPAQAFIFGLIRFCCLVRAGVLARISTFFLFCFQSRTANITLRSSCTLTFTHCALPSRQHKKVCSANCFIIFYLADWVLVSIGYAIMNCVSSVSSMGEQSASWGFVCCNIHDEAFSSFIVNGYPVGCR